MPIHPAEDAEATPRQDSPSEQGPNSPDQNSRLFDLAVSGASEHYFGLRDLDTFKRNLIESNRGKPILLIRFQQLKGVDLVEFVGRLKSDLHEVLEVDDVEYGFHVLGGTETLLMGITPLYSWSSFPNIDSAVGRFHDRCLRTKICSFDYGVARTQCDHLSRPDEIFDELIDSSKRNLEDNLVRWSWTYFNRAYTYISDTENVVVQPTVFIDHRAKTLSVKGGEVFVGGGIYPTYRDLIADIPPDRDMKRVEVLILEKLISGCEKTPGILKFNISPQSLIDTFSVHEKVNRFHRLLHAKGLSPGKVRLELVENPYDESRGSLKEVCQDFYNHGITFAADDFGVRSQSHQVVLNLGIMIKEFKLDPISFRFSVNEDRIKFLDNLAFIEYCKRLADNRTAAITAEAVEDYDTLLFLLEHQINQYQANMFCQKMPAPEFRGRFDEMQGLSEDVALKIFSSPELMARQKEVGNIFTLAREMGEF